MAKRTIFSHFRVSAVPFSPTLDARTTHEWAYSTPLARLCPPTLRDWYYSHWRFALSFSLFLLLLHFSLSLCLPFTFSPTDSLHLSPSTLPISPYLLSPFPRQSSSSLSPSPSLSLSLSLFLPPLSPRPSTWLAHGTACTSCQPSP